MAASAASVGITAGLAILAVPLITSRTAPPAEMFTIVLLLAAALSLLWEQYETGRARLWLLPVAMAAWVNLLPGFLAGLGICAGYLALEGIAMLRSAARAPAEGRVRRSWPWLAATCAVTLPNPWGWGMYQMALRDETARSQSTEWAPRPLDWPHFRVGFNFRDPDGIYLLLIVAFPGVAAAAIRRGLAGCVRLTGAGDDGRSARSFDAVCDPYQTCIFSVPFRRKTARNREGHREPYLSIRWTMHQGLCSWFPPRAPRSWRGTFGGLTFYPTMACGDRG